MLKIARLKYQTKCRKHPRYDPAEGEGAIKGGCADCGELLSIYRAHQTLMKLMRQRPMRAPARRKPAPDPQLTIFTMLDCTCESDPIGRCVIPSHKERKA